MKEKILKLLINSSSFISGEDISKELGITRASVWKYIKALKSDGYQIDGISNKGYKLSSATDIINEFEIKLKLTTEFIGKNIKYFKEVESTNVIAKDLADNNAEDGTLVISEAQSKGKGRFDRYWESPKGGIWASLILRPNLEPLHAAKITLITAAALTNTLRDYDLDVKIKWPNDLLLNGKKFCGILTEMNCDMDRINYLILGFGINVNIPTSDIPDELKDKATSLLVHSGKTFDRRDILCSFLKNFEVLYTELLNTLSIKSTLHICKEHSLLINKKVIISSFNNTEEVTCIDILDSGALLVMNSKGEKQTLLSGDISLSKNYL